MSADSETQSFANHAKMVPGFHYATGLCTLVYVGWSIWHAVSTRSLDAHFQMLGAFALLGVYWYTRAFPLRAQDRIIRLEERLRLARVLPDDLRPRIDELRPGQLIALRFAGDGEVAELVRWVLTDTVTDGKQIKQRIRSWRPDTFRL